MVVHEPDFTCSAIFLGGVKFPTGDSSRIKEEFNEVEIEGAPASGIHGHDLTLGTGSYDGIFGGQMSLRYKSFFFEQNLQFTLRGDGLHQYHFANDLSWSGGAGYYFVRNPRAVVGLRPSSRASTRMWTVSRAARRRTPASRRSLPVRAWWCR